MDFCNLSAKFSYFSNEMMIMLEILQTIPKFAPTPPSPNCYILKSDLFGQKNSIGLGLANLISHNMILLD